MLHRHHIIPRHLGGTDDTSNIVRIDGHCHAVWHWCEWKRTGSNKQRSAWNFLKGRLQHEEDVPLIRSHEKTHRMKKFYGNMYLNFWLQYKSIDELYNEYILHKHHCFNSTGLLDSVVSSGK